MWNRMAQLFPFVLLAVCALAYDVPAAQLGTELTQIRRDLDGIHLKLAEMARAGPHKSTTRSRLDLRVSTLEARVRAIESRLEIVDANLKKLMKRFNVAPVDEKEQKADRQERKKGKKGE